MADSKLVGRKYNTPDLVARVTGQAKYAEDSIERAPVMPDTIMTSLEAGPGYEQLAANI
jgi:hypothetical protein